MDITQRFERCIVGSSPAGGIKSKSKRQRTAYGLWITPDRNRPIMSKSYPHCPQVVYTGLKSIKRTLSITLKDINSLSIKFR